jgi:hypothetical protein
MHYECVTYKYDAPVLPAPTVTPPPQQVTATQTPATPIVKKEVATVATAKANPPTPPVKQITATKT